MQSHKHFAVSGLVVNQEGTKLLMVYHKKLGVWVIPGGHLEPDELPHEGALREVFEETGVKATVESGVSPFNGNKKEGPLPVPYMVLEEAIPEKGDTPAHTHIDLIYLCTADDSAPLVKQEAEVENVKWMTWNEVVNAHTFESIKSFAQQRGLSNERTQIRTHTVL